MLSNMMLPEFGRGTHCGMQGHGSAVVSLKYKFNSISLISAQEFYGGEGILQYGLAMSI